MPIKPSHNVGCIRFLLGRNNVRRSLQSIRTFQLRHCPSPILKKLHEHRRLQHRQLGVEDDIKWIFQLEVLRARDSKKLSLPLLIYMYSPWKYMANKANMLKLKLLWDWTFAEARFVENSKKAAVVITEIIRQKDPNHIARCTTPLGFKQIKHDLADETENTPLQLMRFQRQHIKRAIPVTVRLMRHYDHKFAFIDMVFVGLRRTIDFESKEDQEVERQIQELNFQQTEAAGELPVPHPVVFAEIFVRFRRDYSVKPKGVERAQDIGCPGQWLVSNYKILNFNVLNFDPEYQSSNAKVYDV
ncbi:uncharacterized protein LOC115634063 [Scaptodrosophila lebanonensis]|uniref:Uncharacterized protein LOC115634063 n=1 Tax=Drosophila lebanonensis TaxID=7225 RepID=A0A6J2UGA7_DROLE|nr:uncharacterized protein LOC115634063 [Scaptodrosophila lebanonensis]